MPHSLAKLFGDLRGIEARPVNLRVALHEFLYRRQNLCHRSTLVQVRHIAMSSFGSSGGALGGYGGGLPMKEALLRLEGVL